jgi:hypothetical protein
MTSAESARYRFQKVAFRIAQGPRFKVARNFCSRYLPSLRCGKVCSVDPEPTDGYGIGGVTSANVGSMLKVADLNPCRRECLSGFYGSRVVLENNLIEATSHVHLIENEESQLAIFLS